MLKTKWVVPQVLETGCKPVLLLCKFTSFCLIFFIAYYYCFLFLFTVYLHLCLSAFLYRAFLTHHFHLFDQWWPVAYGLLWLNPPELPELFKCHIFRLYLFHRKIIMFYILQLNVLIVTDCHVFKHFHTIFTSAIA